MSGSFDITVNGAAFRVEGEPAHRTLLQWLRGQGLTGTKEGCAEGDCGACTVAIVETGPGGAPTYRAINACIALLPMFAGREVWTVEGLAQQKSGGATPRMEELHPVQRAMVESYGSQCGYCTPGFVVSMFEAYYRGDVATDPERKIADQLHGNLCRCTGYRPIRDAMMRALEEKRAASGEDLFQLRLEKEVPPPRQLEYAAAGERFLRPTSLEALCTLLKERAEAVIVAGATEIGVEINKTAKSFPLLVSSEAIPELRRVWRDERGWHVGGAATLTQIEEAAAEELPALGKMLSVFASRQIRHRATLAGNLITASPIGDLAPVLLALDATVTLACAGEEGLQRRTVPLADFFTGYRATVRAPDEVLEDVFVPHPPAGVTRRVDSYKVSKRRELDISIVAAAFVVDVKDGVVARARLAYGGVAATPVRAKKAEAALTGSPWDEATLAAVLPVLRGETNPIDDVRSGKDFRVGLVASLFEKFFRGLESEGQDAPLRFAPTAREEVDDPSRALAHESGIGHVTGGAVYVDDEAHRRGPMLEMWPVCSPHAHARVTRRDATKARGMPGVAAVFFAEDIEGHNDVGAVRHDEALLAKDEVCFHGHMVAVVVGESYEACRAAAAAVEVDYEPLPAVRTIDEVIAQESYHNAPHRIARGDVHAALATAPHTLSGTVLIGGQEHFYLESQAAWAECGDDGDVRITSSTQHPSEIQQVVSHVLGLPRNRIVVVSPRMGGGFGGKETQGNTWAALVALAAWRLKKPVRVQLDRDLDMQLTGKRHPFRGDYEAAFDDDGKLLAMRAKLVSDGGWAIDLSEAICDRALFHVDNAYYVPNLEVVGRVGKTNNVSHTAFRGFGGPQGMVVVEEILDRVARELGLPPEVVRERNLYGGEAESRTTHYGQLIEDCRIQPIWRSLTEKVGLEKRREEIARFNAKRDDVKRGIAITPVKFGISFTATPLNQAGALLLVYRDGTVQVNHGGTEMGQGLYTKVRGVAMRELGLSAGRVRVMKTQTDKVANTSATAASSGADLNGAAVKDACDTLRARLTPVAARLLAAKLGGGAVDPTAVLFARDAVFVRGRERSGVPFQVVCEHAHAEQISMVATGYYRTPGIGYDRVKGKGKPFYYFAFGAAVTEVEVDALSGMKRVRRVDILHDVGDSLNPGIDRGQIEGGFVQGMGWLTGEELKWDDRGRLLAHSASTYQIPAISDAPFDFRVELWPRAPQAGTIHGSKAVGEPPLMLAISVREAIRDAIAAFGEPGGQVELGCPATHEAIYAAVQRRRGGRRVSIAAEE